jgi:hypothetical protein
MCTRKSGDPFLYIDKLQHGETYLYIFPISAKKVAQLLIFLFSKIMLITGLNLSF